MNDLVTVNAIESPEVQSCLATMEAAIDQFNGARKNAFESCIVIGNAAGIVREKLAHGQFGPWVEKHFGAQSAHPMSVQWIRICINAAKVLALTNEANRPQLIEQFSEVRKIAQLLPDVEAGRNPLEAQPEDEQSEEAQSTGKATLSVEALQAFPELRLKEKELDKREKDLDKREEALNKREAKLAARESALDTREAALKEREKEAKAKAKKAKDVPAELLASATEPNGNAEAF